MKNIAVFTAIAAFIILAGLAVYTAPLESRVPDDTSRPEVDTEVLAAELRKRGEPVIFRGICDGSAAVIIGGNTLLVAYDELNSLFAFSLSGGSPSARTDLSRILDLEDSDEIDIEAAAVGKDRIWWIGSHSLDLSGNDAPNRRVLFATSIPSPDLVDLTIVSQPLDLMEVLLRSANAARVLTKESRKLPPGEGGISIEGLATTPDGGLLVGFRSPLSGEGGISGDALVVRLAPEGNTFRVKSVDQLDLDNRGIRDIVYHNNEYTIIAGPATPYGKYALYAWDGTAQPVKIRRIRKLRAEGLVSLGDHWMILSDDGKVKRSTGAAADSEMVCDRIRKKSGLGEGHPNVYFHARVIRKK